MKWTEKCDNHVFYDALEQKISVGIILDLYSDLDSVTGWNIGTNNFIAIFQQ